MSADAARDLRADGSAGAARPVGPPVDVSSDSAADGGQPRAVAAIDLGATSGRVMLGVVARGRIELLSAHRFENRLAPREGHLSWDLDALWADIQQGLSAAHALALARGLPGLSSIGVDSWAVDYALIGPATSVPVTPTGTASAAAGPFGMASSCAASAPAPTSLETARMGEVIAYRDSRTDGVAERFSAQVTSARQFALTGIAQQPFNTLYQLAADDRLAALPPGSTALLVPDAIGFLLTGRRRTELTNASTTGMLAAGEAAWVPELLAAAGVDAGLFAPFIAPGEVLGTVRPELAERLGIEEVPVIAVGSHDTASAVLAVPAAPSEGPVAFISSGTWSLIGLELAAPVTTEAAHEAGFTNEGGVDGTVRFLKNVSGMWLVSESIRQWEEDGERVALDDLLAAAAAVPGGRFRIDPTDPQFLTPGRMADRVREAARPLGEDESPRTPAELVRCLLESLAETYRDELQAACQLARVDLPKRLHVVGGGSRNALLNQLTADALGIEVIAGPMEATALGNVAIQSRALGAVSHEPGAIRALVRESVELESFPPSTTKKASLPAAIGSLS
ncbi:rhamnulokinase [Brachybacterium paraconglomeratum]|uniref:rhamnulokinase n=1 Tax=Brachybacterium paraconglomeratum TaxID=173362 RepID=UPI00026C72BB|nr:rhamnulokinase family protein [Brachybacterium paraconglomeratum]